MNEAKWKRQSEGVLKIGNLSNEPVKNYVEMIPEDDEPEMTISTRIPDSEPSQSYGSKYPQDFGYKCEKINHQKQL